MSRALEESVTVDFIANPTQRQFIESHHQADLFDSRKGEGKSAALCWACFYHTLHNPGANWLFIRDTYENLKRTTLQEFFSWFRPGVFGEWRAGDKEFVWNTARTGLKGRVMFMGVETPEDASKIASMPLAGFAIDEPSGAAGESSGVAKFVFDTAFAQLRQRGMNWYAAKLAQNNPDESHWTYKMFWDPGTPSDDSVALLPQQQSGFKAWQTKEPENNSNLPPGYYENIARTWGDRPDLVRRFVEGKHGFQQVGKQVTPEWIDELHLADNLTPVRGTPLWLLYDGGLNPTCVVTQLTPLGTWQILECFTDEGIGMYELIGDVVKPALAGRYPGYTWYHTGDPNLNMREQSSANQSAAKVIQKELGGRFIPGPVKIDERVDPLRYVLTRTRNGRGVLQVDRERAKEVWHALRGGWHRRIARGGQVGEIVKNVHSHPGDCIGYGAARLFPLGKLRGKAKTGETPRAASYFNRAPHPGTSMGMSRKDIVVPKEAKVLEPGKGRLQRG